MQGAGGNITISKGTITATGGLHAAGIGQGRFGSGGTFNTTTEGNAFIVASSISDISNEAGWSGVIFQGNVGKVYATGAENTVRPTQAATIPLNTALTNETGRTLDLTGCRIINNDTIHNYGFINLELLVL